jgi:hypothetical protein
MVEEKNTVFVELYDLALTDRFGRVLIRRFYR